MDPKVDFENGTANSLGSATVRAARGDLRGRFSSPRQTLNMSKMCFADAYKLVARGDDGVGALEKPAR
ncbi:hypothetical protein D3C84_973460 [compost metagenome]